MSLFLTVGVPTAPVHDEMFVAGRRTGKTKLAAEFLKRRCKELRESAKAKQNVGTIGHVSAPKLKLIVQELRLCQQMPNHPQVR